MNTISSFAGMVFGVGLISLFFSIFIVASIPPENSETPLPYYQLIALYTTGLTFVGCAGAYFLNLIFSFF